MLHEPRVTNGGSEFWPFNAKLSTPSGNWYYASDQPSSNPSFLAEEEYLDDVSSHNLRQGLHYCGHSRIKRQIVGSHFWRNQQSWYMVGYPSQGYWDHNYRPPSLDYGWSVCGRYNTVGGETSGPLALYGQLMDPVKGLPVLGYMDPDRGLVTPLPDDIDNLVSHAITAMLPGIKPASNLSLVNSIIELKDFRSLPRTLNNLKASHLWSDFIALIAKSGRTQTLRKLLRKSADAYLQTQFNILPLLSDICSIQAAVRTARNQLRQLVARVGTAQKRFYTSDLGYYYKDTYDNRALNAQTYMVPTQLLYGRHVTYRTKRFNALMEYSYTLPSWTTEDSLMEALLDRFGVNLNPRIIWNAIPWSFVVDWVANVNSWLDNWRSRNIEPIVNIRGFCWSVHVERFVTTSLGWNSADPCVEVYQDSYRRVVPETSALYSSLVTSGLSPKEFSLAAALALTR